MNVKNEREPMPQPIHLLDRQLRNLSPKEIHIFIKQHIPIPDDPGNHFAAIFEDALELQAAAWEIDVLRQKRKPELMEQAFLEYEILEEDIKASKTDSKYMSQFISATKMIAVYLAKSAGNGGNNSTWHAFMDLAAIVDNSNPFQFVKMDTTDKKANPRHTRGNVTDLTLYRLSRLPQYSYRSPSTQGGVLIKFPKPGGEPIS